jgi:putative DNA primase/helicase
LVPSLQDPGDGWDAGLLLLGVQNGVIDLRAGALREGKPSDKITQVVPIEFDPNAQCPKWLQFLDQVFIKPDGKPDAELIGFIQRAVGYSLTGLGSEQCLFLCYGHGSNGKSTFLSTIRVLLGPMGFNSPFATFEKYERSSIPNDLAALEGKRLVTASETNVGSRLNEARLKALTGGDVMTARFLNKEFFEFQPKCKLWFIR